MPRYSIPIRTVREVVVNAKDEAQARVKAARYAKDVMPTTVTREVLAVDLVANDYTSRTCDDADEIPRDT